MSSPSAHELQQLTTRRLDEARALLAAQQFSGAWYIAGYAVELALKACVCKALSLMSYPENEVKKAFLTHQVSDLVLLAGLRDQLQRERSARPMFAGNWDVVAGWAPSDRYVMERTQQEVNDLLQAMQDPREGVITWLSQQW